MLTIDALIVDAKDPERLAAFWADVLGGWTVEREHDPASGETQVWIAPPDRAQGPDILFAPNTDPKLTKNRWHLDLRPTDQEAAVERALNVGATRVDIGQTGSETWVVLADPEGNEFCILRAAQES